MDEEAMLFENNSSFIPSQQLQLDIMHDIMDVEKIHALSHSWLYRANGILVLRLLAGSMEVRTLIERQTAAIAGPLPQYRDSMPQSISASRVALTFHMLGLCSKLSCGYGPLALEKDKQPLISAPLVARVKLLYRKCLRNARLAARDSRLRMHQGPGVCDCDCDESRRGRQAGSLDRQ